MVIKYLIYRLVNIGEIEASIIWFITVIPSCLGLMLSSIVNTILPIKVGIIATLLIPTVWLLGKIIKFIRKDYEEFKTDSIY